MFGIGRMLGAGMLDVVWLSWLGVVVGCGFGLIFERQHRLSFLFSALRIYRGEMSEVRRMLFRL